MKQTFEIDLPIKIGDKVWLSNNKGFGSCSFLERYTQYSEYTVTNVQVEFNMKTNDSRIVFSVDGKDCDYIYNGKTAFTKEELYESFRFEIEQLIPEDLRDYLWKDKIIEDYQHGIDQANDYADKEL